MATMQTSDRLPTWRKQSEMRLCSMAAIRRSAAAVTAAFGWRPEDIPDPQAPETFERSKLDWREPGREPHRAMLEWYKGLIRLRRENAALRRPLLEEAKVRFDDQERWIAIERGTISIL